MKALPSVALARYKRERHPSLPGYLHLTDVLCEKTFVGRELPQMPHVADTLRHWCSTNHPSFLPIHHYLDTGNSYLVVFDSLLDAQALAGMFPSQMKQGKLHQIFRELAHAFQFIADQQLCFPQLDLSKLYLTPNGLRIVGHETALFLGTPKLDEDVSHLDTRYAAPELVSSRLKTAKSDIFHLASLFYHFLTGTSRDTHEELFESEDTRSHYHCWATLLRDMLQALPDQRLGWDELWQRLKSLPGASDMGERGFVWLEKEAHQSITYLQDCLVGVRNEAKAVALQGYPAYTSRLAPLVRHAESEGFLVFHCQGEEGEIRPYKIVNDIIHLLKRGVLPMLERPDLVATIEPLSQWKTMKQELDSWQCLLKRLLPALFPNRSKGILMLIEEVQYLDASSLQALATLSTWLAEIPFLFVLTGRTFNHKNFRNLKENIPFSWQYYHPPRLDQKQAERLIWSATGKPAAWLGQALTEIGLEEFLLSYWINDHFGLPDGIAHFLDQSWLYLSDQERLILQLLSCSERALNREDLMKVGRELQRPRKVLRRMAQARFVCENPPGHWQIVIPALIRYCFRKIVPSEVPAIRLRLLKHERTLPKPDLVQLALLTSDEGTAYHYFHRLNQRIYQTFELVPLWRLERIYRKTKRPAFREYALLASILRGEMLNNRSVTDYPQLVVLSKGARMRAKSPDRGARAFMTAASKRVLQPILQGYCLVLAAEAAVPAGEHLLAGRAWRRFKRIDRSALNETTEREWLSRFASALIQLDRSDEKLNAQIAGMETPLWNWVAACQHWAAGDFKDCLAKLEVVIAQLEDHYDLNWRGMVLKLYGNALFRNNIPEQAILAYQAAESSFIQTHNQSALQQVRFNLASAENLAGQFDSSRQNFKAIEKQARSENDNVTRCQVQYYFMVCDLFQNQIESFEKHFGEHARLAHTTQDRDEKIRGLSLLLHNALARPKSVNSENITQLERLLAGKVKVNSLLENEAKVALRWAHFAMGTLTELVEPPYPQLTRWRHELLDYLTGKGSTFRPQLQHIGSGYFGACHLFLVKTAIEAELITDDDLTGELAKAFEEQVRKHNANYSYFLRKHFQHVHGLGEVDRKQWERALTLFERLNMPPNAKDAREVLSALKTVWPHQLWGVVIQRTKQWVALERLGNLPDPAILEHLNWLGKMPNRRPLATSYTDPLKQRRGLLLLPVTLNKSEFGLVWLVGDQEIKQEMSTHYEPLLRFYARLLTFSLQSESELAVVEEECEHYGIVGRCPPLMELLKKLAKYACSDLNIYIWGESGTGKELVARAIHKASERSHKPFRAVNCSHFPENLVEAHLFGHTRGSYTGATSDQAGLLELVDGGSLFLDEVGDINSKIQSTLLRVVQEGEFSRVGETQVRKVDIRFITATNKNIHEMINKKQFREDLYFRIVEEELLLPPLRQRMEDLPLLAHHFVKRYSPTRTVVFRRDFYEHLRSYHWPGNIREFESYIRKLLVEWPQAQQIGAKECLPFLRRVKPIEGERSTLDQIIEKTRVDLVVNRLKDFGGNRTRTAISLGISRQSLIKFLDRHRLK